MNTSIASNEHWRAGAAEKPTHPETSLDRQAHEGGGRRTGLRIGGVLQDVALAIVVVLLCPLAIVVLGAPVVLFVRLLIEIAERM